MAKDPARQETDDLLEELERKIEKEYQRAAEELQRKADSYFARFKARDAQKQALVRAGKLTQEEYEKWKIGALMHGDRYKQMITDLSRTAVNADKAAMKIVNDSMEDVFIINANYGAYEVERATGIDTNFTLYNRDAVNRLLKDEPELLPGPKPGSTTDKKLKENKDLIWNRQHLNSAILQGLLQGDSMDKIAKRLRSVTDMDKKAAIRNARTMVTSAENSGKMHSFERAVAMGIEGKKMWMATHDNRTRESHAMLDGELRELHEQFTNGLMQPGDMTVNKPEEVYNCRCTMLFVSNRSRFATHYDERNQTLKIGGKTYAVWKEESYEKWKRRHPAEKGGS